MPGWLQTAESITLMFQSTVHKHTLLLVSVIPASLFAKENNIPIERRFLWCVQRWYYIIRGNTEKVDDDENPKPKALENNNEDDL